MSPIDHFRRAPHTRARGGAAEDDGVAWLEGQGYRVVERNVVFRTGEIDVVAVEGEVLCFVEIKARANRRYGGSLWAVDRRKQRQIAAAASLYLVTRGYDGACRFDVLGMDAEEGGWSYTLVRNAFEVG